MRTIEICFEIAELCEKYGDAWSHTFTTFGWEFENGDVPAVARKVTHIYGGMGSFNDLVLHKDGRMVGADNDKLDMLREELFQEIIKNL
ncbi:MAG: hypothetical protein V4649_07425 [Bacteroidota bacterium]